MLSKESFIIPSRDVAPGLYDLIHDHYSSFGFAPRITQHPRQMQTVISLVSSGMGFALVPPSVRNLKRRGIQYRRLRGAAAQFNRYNQRKISVTDEVGDMRIGGSFQLKNVDAFCRLLERAYGLQVEYQPEQIKISAR